MALQQKNKPKRVYNRQGFEPGNLAAVAGGVGMQAQHSRVHFMAISFKMLSSCLLIESLAQGVPSCPQYWKGRKNRSSRRILVFE